MESRLRCCDAFAAVVVTNQDKFSQPPCPYDSVRFSPNQRNLVSHLMIAVKNPVDPSALIEVTDIENGPVRTSSNEFAVP